MTNTSRHPTVGRRELTEKIWKLRRQARGALGVIGLILGPLAETQAPRALAISQGNPAVFITQPISGTILAISFLLLVVPLIVQLIRRRERSLRMEDRE